MNKIAEYDIKNIIDSVIVAKKRKAYNEHEEKKIDKMLGRWILFYKNYKKNSHISKNNKEKKTNLKNSTLT